MLDLPQQRLVRPLATPVVGVGRYFLFAAVCAALGFVSFAIDLPCSLAFKDPSFFGVGEVMRLFSLSEVFAHGTGVALICITVLVLDRARRRAVLRLVVTAYGSGLAADVVKLLVPRIRPARFVDEQILDSFRFARLPQLEPIDPWALASFPSAHAATAVGLALGLSRMYPHGRWLFAAFAVLAVLQRVSVRAHWPSDAFFGAAVAFLVTALIWQRQFGGNWLDRWEAGAVRATK